MKNSAEANKRMDRMDAKLNRIDGNVGDLKGHFGMMLAQQRAVFIALQARLQWQRTMDIGELVPIWQAAQNAGLTAGISSRDRDSFWEADLVLEALDAEGELRYMAVEASYTADVRETDRAIRNAEFLTRFTGVPTYAVAASVYVDDRIRHILIEDDAHPHGQKDEEQVLWFKLPEPERPR